MQLLVRFFHICGDMCLLLFNISVLIYVMLFFVECIFSVMSSDWCVLLRTLRKFCQEVVEV